MKFSSLFGTLSSVLLTSSTVNAAISLDVNDPASIKKAASTIAYGMVKYYTGNNTGDVPGNLPSPYYWWETGAMFGGLVDYWYYTGDDSYNKITTQALQFQVGPDNDYMPPNQSKSLGNDDQGFWGMAAMSAAEAKYPDPPSTEPSWLALAQAVFNTQASRWDNSTCGGGLRWQIFTFNNGFNYKNSISNGCFFNLGARLAKYTGNETYANWAETTWDWVERVGLMSSDYHFFDGSDDTTNCSSVNHIQWTYNAGIYLYGAAAMWNHTQSDVWKQRVLGVLNATSVFFSSTAANVMYEVACETNGKCDVDQRSFKAYLSRWMSATAKVAPFTRDTIMTKLKASAQAAAKSCTAGSDGNQCGLQWTTGTNDGSLGVGEQMSAMEVIQGLLMDQVAGPVTNSTGGTSKGNPNAGSDSNSNPLQLDALTTGDRVGAGFLTTLVLVSILGGAWWMIS